MIHKYITTFKINVTVFLNLVANNYAIFENSNTQFVW